MDIEDYIHILVYLYANILLYIVVYWDKQKSTAMLGVYI